MKPIRFLLLGFVFWIAGSMISVFTIPSMAEGAQSKQSRSRDRLAEDFAPDGPEFASSGFPPAATMRKLCYDPAVPKFRRAHIINAGYDQRNPGAMDFDRFDTLVGLSEVTVYLNKSKTAHLPCFRELVTLSIKMLTPSFGELVMSVDENTRIESMYLNDDFENARASQPTGYSTSGYYLDVLRREFGFIPKSITKIPSLPSTLKASVKIIPAKTLETRVAQTNFVDRAGTLEPAYFGFSKRGMEGGLAITQSILIQYTERFAEGKPCPLIPISETEAELKSGVTVQDLEQRFHDTAVASAGCRQSLN